MFGSDDEVQNAPELSGVGEFIDSLHRFLDGLPLLAWMTDWRGELVFVNGAWREFTGAPHVDDEDADLLGRVLPEDRTQLQRIIKDAVVRHQPFQTEFQLRRADGQYRWFVCFTSPFHTEAGDFDGLVGMCLDLTERRQREEQLAYMATHDSLTGLPNRRMFESSLSRAVSRARRGTPAVLLMLDVDNFKSYNDSLGHLAGDQALVNFSLLLRQHVRSGDLLARIGGDEFAVLFEQTDLPEAESVAERMRRAATEEEFVTRSREIGLGISAGLVLVDGALEARAVFDLADVAMYQAKERGRNQVCILDSQDAKDDGDADRIIGRLREALADKQFVLHYQPVIRLSDHRVAYYEVLVRMLSPSGDVIMPAEFLPTAERLGLMPRLTRLVIGMAIRSLSDNEGAALSINLSHGDLADDSLPRYVDEELRRQGVDPSRLVFEMSESAVVGNLASARNWIDRLGRLGCSFVLDEFGAGLGLFGLLRELPFDQVKLDGSIITALSVDGESATFVEAVRGLIESQGHVAVASWVEDAGLLERVRNAGFELGQGYHLQVPSSDLAALIRDLGGATTGL